MQTLHSGVGQMVIGRNIEYLRLKYNYSQNRLAEMLGYKSFTTIQKWESGVSSPPLKTFIQLAKIFNVNLDDFATVDLSAAERIPDTKSNKQVIPIYDRIPPETPIEDVTDIEDYTPLSDSMRLSRFEFFALRLNGDSMSPKYSNGDIVIFERQNGCNNGDECAVRLKGEDVTLKKVYFTDRSVILQPINTTYAPIQIDNIEELEILGIAREIRRNV